MSHNVRTCLLRGTDTFYDHRRKTEAMHRLLQTCFSQLSSILEESQATKQSSLTERGKEMVGGKGCNSPQLHNYIFVPNRKPPLSHSALEVKQADI